MNTVSRAERIQALVFLLVGVSVATFVCLFIVGLPGFAKRTHKFFIRFHETVPDLEGTAVRYRGVKKGKVTTIAVDDARDEVIVVVELDPDLRVTESTVAKISQQGLIGAPFIELSGTVADSPPIPPESTIPADPSTMRRILEAGTNMVDRIDRILVNLERWTGPENEKRVQDLLDAATMALNTLNQTFGDLRPEVQRLVGNYADVGADLHKFLEANAESLTGTLREANATFARLRRYLESGRLETVSDEAVTTLQGVRGDLNRASTALTNWINENAIGKDFHAAVESLGRVEVHLGTLLAALETELVALARGELGPSLRTFRDAMRDLADLVRVLREDPSLVIFSQPRPETPIPPPRSK